MLDPAAEQIQNARKQRERIYDDDTYIMPTLPPDDAPEWAKIPDKSDVEAQYDNPSEIQYDNMDLTNPYFDFILNSAEMNSIRPEDLDEQGESSTAVS